MGRAPCCEEKGLKKGPWIPEEDQILISYIQRHGHGNWRALPKQAGLLRCGKSCRLRWTNYLRPDIKRGNFTAEEEETIMKLHQMLGNRWSAIAAKLPGRTDNEIKNHWRTHLKKRMFNDTMTINTDATDMYQINGHQDERVDYDSVRVKESTTKVQRRQCPKQQCKSTAIPKKESESKSQSDESMGSEGYKDRGNAIDHKDSDLSNEDFWAEVLLETSFSIEDEGGFEAQSASTLLAPTIFDVTQAWGLKEDLDPLVDIWGRHIY